MNTYIGPKPGDHEQKPSKNGRTSTSDGPASSLSHLAAVLNSRPKVAQLRALQERANRRPQVQALAQWKARLNQRDSGTVADGPADATIQRVGGAGEGAAPPLSQRSSAVQTAQPMFVTQLLRDPETQAEITIEKVNGTTDVETLQRWLEEKSWDSPEEDEPIFEAIERRISELNQPGKETPTKEEQLSEPVPPKARGKTAKGRHTQGKEASTKGLPESKEDLAKSLAKSLERVARVPGGLETLLRPYLTYKGTDKQWLDCRQWANELLAGSAKPVAVSTKSKDPLREFLNSADIEHTQPVTEVNILGVQSNEAPISERTGTTAYVANLITTPANLQKLLAPYEALFDEGIGFAMVVGVNLFRSLDQSHDERLSSIQMPQVNFPLTIIQFSWDLPWTRPYSAVYEKYKEYSSEPNSEKFATDVKAYEKSFLRGSKNSVPYGLLRTTVLGSAATANYLKALAQHFEQVYIFNSDADAPSFKTADSRPLLRGYTEEIEKLKSGNKPAPRLLVGGYRFDYEGYGGDLDPMDPPHRLTFLANQLDSAFRSLLSELNSELIYPTEPNMGFLAAEKGQKKPEPYTSLTTLTETFGNRTIHHPSWGFGPREGVTLRENLKAVTGSNFKTVYLPGLSTPTDSTRFRIPPRRPEPQNREEFFDERVASMFSEEQTYITKLAVTVSGSGLPGKVKLGPTEIEQYIVAPLRTAIKTPDAIPTGKSLLKTIQRQKDILTILQDGTLIGYFLEKNKGLIEDINRELNHQYDEILQPTITSTSLESSPLSLESTYGLEKEIPGAEAGKQSGYAEYDEVIREIRNTVTLPEPGSSIFPQYPISEQQAGFLEEHNFELTGTFPDGDCSINSVAESLGVDWHPQDVREAVYESHSKSSDILENDILEPGYWASSHKILDWLSEHKKIRIVIVAQDGSEEEIQKCEAPEEMVYLLHVASEKGAHFYGTRKKS